MDDERDVQPVQIKYPLNDLPRLCPVLTEEEMIADLRQDIAEFGERERLGGLFYFAVGETAVDSDRRHHAAFPAACARAPSIRASISSGCTRLIPGPSSIGFG